jgi:hypothetical protein
MVDPAIAAKFIDMLKKLGVTDSTCELVEQELMGETPKPEAPEEEKKEDAPKVMGVEVIKVDKTSTPPSSGLD